MIPDLTGTEERKMHLLNIVLLGWAMMETSNVVQAQELDNSPKYLMVKSEQLEGRVSKLEETMQGMVKEIQQMKAAFHRFANMFSASALSEAVHGVPHKLNKREATDSDETGLSIDESLDRINLYDLIQALRGVDGRDGHDGQPGRDGAKGDTGSRGLMGPKGAPGNPGADGVNGSKGLEGERGPVGQKGERGSNGSDGGQGPKGERGQRGEGGARGLSGQKGDSGTNGKNGVRGPKGERGLPGKDGEKGDTGTRGLIGPKGVPGNPGADGVNGSKGLTGERGEPGARGPIGQKGERGSNGSNGSQGSKGARGQRGEVGSRGPAGQKGDRGRNGVKGGQGQKGEKGRPGEKGLPGSPGKNGGTCPEGWTKTDPGTCIKYFDTKKNYRSAKSSCANLMDGAVVTLETEEKIAFFNTFLAQQGELGTKIWLGALKARGKWRWDGLHTGPLTSTNWDPAKREPNNEGGNENCIETYTNGVWRDQECSDSNRYVCEIPAQ